MLHGTLSEAKITRVLLEYHREDEPAPERSIHAVGRSGAEALSVSLPSLSIIVEAVRCLSQSTGKGGSDESERVRGLPDEQSPLSLRRQRFGVLDAGHIEFRNNPEYSPAGRLRLRFLGLLLRGLLRGRRVGQVSELNILGSYARAGHQQNCQERKGGAADFRHPVILEKNPKSRNLRPSIRLKIKASINYLPLDGEAGRWRASAVSERGAGLGKDSRCVLLGPGVSLNLR
jgi:hypothetical protein